MNAQFLNDMIKQFRLRWQLSRSEIIARYAIFVGIILGLVLVCSFLGKFSAWGVNSGQYWMWSVSIFCFGAMYLAILFPGAVISISSALFGNQDKRINTRASVPEIVPKISSFFATLATGWVLFPVVIMAAIPAQNLGAFWIAAMSAGALAFLIFNRPNRGTFTLWIGCGTSGFFLATAALLNIVPTALVLWNRHVEPVTGSVSAPMVPSWIGTIFWVVLALVILAVVIRLMARLLGGVLGAAEGIIKTLITAVAVVLVVAIIIGGIGYALYAVGASATPSYATASACPSQEKANVLPTPAPTEKKSDSNVQISLPANIEWLAIGVRGTICGTASGQANAGEGNPLTNPDGDPNRVMSDWCGHPYLAPGAPEGVLVGKDGPNGKTFIMGSSFSGVKINDELFVAINDASGTFQNNEGGYTLNLQVK